MSKNRENGSKCKENFAAKTTEPQNGEPRSPFC